jgi:hypothetical protein
VLTEPHVIGAVVARTLIEGEQKSICPTYRPSLEGLSKQRF